MPELPEAPSIGRERPLAVLLDTFKVTLSGTGRVCVIAGEAGVGKTRLLDELLGRVEAHECYVLRGRAQDYDHGIAYASLRDLLASSPTEEVDEAWEEDYQALTRALDADVLGRRNTDERSEKLQPAYLLVTRYLQSLALRRPTVVALDDAHLADDETLTALSLAARYLATAPLLLVLSARRDQWVPGSSFAATIGRLIDSGLGLVTDLHPLDLDDTIELIGASLGARSDDRLTSYVFAQSRGNPLFARETLRSLREVGAIRSEHGKAYLVGNPGTGTISRRSALLHRVFQQHRAARDMARVMSAFRRVRLNQIPALQDVIGLPAERIEAAFDSLTRASIIRQVAGGAYEFTHPLMAEVLYGDLGPLERRRLHRLIAASFRREQLSDLTDVLEWTTHVAESAIPGDPVALAAVLDAARFTYNAAPLSAATWYERALDLLPPESPERADLLSRRAVALWKGSRPEAAIEVGREALAGLASGTQRERTLATIINANYAMGRYGAALETVHAHLANVDDPGPFLAQRALLLAHTGRSVEAQTQREAAQAHTVTRPVGDQAIIHSYLGHVANCFGEFDEVRRAVDRLRLLGLSTEPSLATGARLSALESAAYLLAITGCASDASEVLARIAVLLPQTGWQDIGGQNVYAKAKLDHLAGRWGAALDVIRAGAISLEFAGLRNNLAYLRLLEAEIVTDQGHLDEASKALQEPLLSDECVLYAMLRNCRMARIAMAIGEHDRAEGILKETAATAATTSLAEPHRQSLEALVELGLATDRPADAAAYTADLQDLAARTGLPLTVISADLAKASLGDPQAGQRVVERCELEGLVFPAAQAHLHLGCAGIDPERHLGRALDLFSSMDALAWTRRASTHARALGLSFSQPHPPNRRSSPGTGLTETEVRLVELLRQGLTNRQVSAVLHYSAKTVEVYLSRLYQKAGCHSRLELVLAAERGELAELASATHPRAAP